MSTKLKRADAIFERIKARTGMSEAGADWLKAVLDPFHDEKLMVCGYPDRETAPTVVQIIKQSLAIVKPTSYGANDNWGFHVRIDDNLYSATSIGTGGNFVLTTNRNLALYDYTAGSTGTYVQYGGLTIIFFNQTVNGTSEIVTTPSTSSGNTNFSAQLQIDPAEFDRGKTRRIACGFEVVNTTSELYKGGALAVYEQPGSKEEPFTVYYATVLLNPGGSPQGLFVDTSEDEKSLKEESSFESGSTMVPVVSFTPWDLAKLPSRNYYVQNGRGKFVKIDTATLPNLVYTMAGTFTRDVLPPRTLAELLILPGSQQWDAKHGCMCVGTMNDMENPSSFTIPQGKWFIVNETVYPLGGFTLSPTANTTGSFMTLPISYSQTNGVFPVLPELVRTPFNTKGAVVSGQLPQATFTINYNEIIEREISSQNKNLATLAKPSPPEDYIATQLYSEICQRIPIACYQNANDFGSWFLGMADQVANVVSTIGKPIMKAVDYYQESRSGINPTGATFVKSNPMPIVPMRGPKVGGKFVQKKGMPVTVKQGPRMANNKFTTDVAKEAKKERKKAKRKAKKAAARAAAGEM